MSTKAKTNTRSKTYSPVQVPTKLKDLTLGDYIRFMELIKVWNDSDSPHKDLELITAWHGQDFMDMPEYIAQGYIDEWFKEMSDTAQIEKAITDGKINPPKQIRVAGMNFTVPNNMAHQCKMSQYVDYAKYEQMYSGVDYGFYAITLAIFLKKPKELYSQIRLDDRIETMKKVNLIEAVKCVAFFLTQSKQFAEITNHYWRRREAQNQVAERTQRS
jgi:hypothetical protein